MSKKQQQEPVADLTGYTTVGDWKDRFGGPFFETSSSLDWFIKRNRDELIRRGALIPRKGRSGSLLSIKRMPSVVLDILRRKALAEREAA